MRRMKYKRTTQSRTEDQAKNKRIKHLVNLIVLADDRVKIKISDKIEKHLDLFRTEKALEHGATVIPVVVGALGTILKDLRKRLG